VTPDVQFVRVAKSVALFAIVALAAVGAVRATETVRINLAPRFFAGESMTYAIETHTTTAGRTVTPIADSGGPTQSALTISLRERLEVLSVQPQTAGQSVRFRLTWEASQADALSNGVDPSNSDPTAPFTKLQGQSMEFTLASDGALSDFKGLADVLPGGVPPAEAVEWISALTAANQFPSGGVAIGQQWKSEMPIAGTPLAGLFWQSESSYQHDESCPILPQDSTTQQTPGASGPANDCAVILSQMTIARHGSSHGDATPPEYLHHGLRTSGAWTGTGSLLGSISIQTGILVSATESSTQDMDYEIKSASSGSSIHYMAKVQSDTGITLVAFTQVAAATHE
jgi:hypothetical protein